MEYHLSAESMFRYLIVGIYRLQSSSRLGHRFVSSGTGRRVDRNSGKWKKWTPLPLGVGFAYIAYQQYGHVREREERHMGVVREPKPFKPWQVSLYTSLPLRYESRVFGWLSRLELPVFLRQPLIGLFARTMGCDLSELVEEDLSKYASLNEFFRRPVKPELRPIANDCLTFCIPEYCNTVIPDPALRQLPRYPQTSKVSFQLKVSPADGLIQACGRLFNDKIEQVKGYSYTLAAFVGDDLAEELINRRKKSKDRELFYCVVYLSPADCHRFYAPTKWSIKFRRHITGYLLGVNKKVVSRVPHALSINERVLLTGEWQYGFFSMTPVGATHVGSIVLDCEATLKTNCPKKRVGDVCDTRYQPVQKKPGDCVGEFNMGSSVVLIFEAPKGFQFVKNTGEKLKYGDSLGKV